MPGIQEPVTCTGPPHQPSAPFLSSPYGSWAEIASYFDHDYPDYAVDGKMILASGLTVSGPVVPGAFPSYWSAQLRQDINYDGHNGYDYDISYQPVLAAAPGVVSYAAWETSDPYYGYGQMIVIKHADGYMTLYGHLSKILVRPGQRVRAGQEVAISGTTGHSTGPHLHFTVYHDCHVVDPYGWGGKGHDPLARFDGESSVYLWKSGDAPLVLNTLPGWPTFATGARAPVPQGPSQPPIHESGDVAHLLLLAVPRMKSTAPDVAVAAFESQIASERRQLLQILGLLSNEGAITSYRSLPQEGAVLVDSRLTPAQLTGLPGVASILGDRPKDLIRASDSLEQALTLGLRQPPPPSLFPSTFLDAQLGWQLTASVQEGGPYVVGFTQPGATVAVSVYRGKSLIGTAKVSGQAGSGSFAVAVLDRHENEVAIESGDTVKLASLDQVRTVSVLPLAIAANAGSRSAQGNGPFGAHLSISAVQNLAGSSTTEVSTRDHGSAGRHPFRVRFSGRFLPGDSVVASLVEASGNEIFTVNRVRGFDATVGSSTIQGWGRPGSKWTADAFASHYWQGSGRATTQPDGYVRLTMARRDGRPFFFRTGSHIRLRSSGRTIWIGAPDLSQRLNQAETRLYGVLSSGWRVTARTWSATADAWHPSQVARRPHARFVVFLRQHKTGQGLQLLFQSSSGNVVQMLRARRSVSVGLKSGHVTGHAAAGQTILLRDYDPSHRLVGAGVTESDSSGRFSAGLFDRKAGLVHPRPGDSLAVSIGGLAWNNYAVPSIAASESFDARTVTGATDGTGHVSLVLPVRRSRLAIVNGPIVAGHFSIDLPYRTGLKSITLRVGSSVRGESTLVLPVSAPVPVTQLVRRFAVEAPTAH